MRSREFITELFDQPYPVRIFADQAVAKDPKGRPLYVVFDRYPAWETVKITFDRGGDFSLTDWRDEYRVFATVVEAIRQWAAKYQPGSMYFSVPQDEPTNRMRLYQRMVAALASGSGYTEISDPDRVDDDAISYYMARIGKRFGDDRFWWLVRDSLIKDQQQIKEDLSPEDAQQLWIKNYGEEMAERVFYNIKNELLFAVSDLCSIRSSACDTKDRLEAMSRTEFARWVLTYFTDALEQNGWPEAYSEGLAQVIRDRVRQPLLNKQSLLENLTNKNQEPPIKKIIQTLQTRFGTDSLSGGNCGMFALAVAEKMKELGHPVTLGLLYKEIPGIETLDDIVNYETDVYHVVIEYDNKYYDGTGQVSADDLLSIAKNQYRDTDPGFFTEIDPGDPSVQRVIRSETNWTKHPAEFYQTLSENFADGKKPGRKGISRRVGIPKKATLGQLEKIARSSTGERRRMAQWQLNMRRGKKK